MSSKSDNNKSFEQKLAELEEISEQLQSDTISLDEAISLYEKGIKLSKECADKLNTAKQKIEKLTAAESDCDD